ncbi:hypothetical protein PVAND_009503 [Polypedilum vanderplanki]|uniref:Histone H2A n=1 Tax=Polypedilum vanderplanki TaxID=319348 RepID=A0A9J6CDR8_POLVA|nr:hypothetical protein PVAND_009503 [Polypedilum vanderplanki]
MSQVLITSTPLITNSALPSVFSSENEDESSMEISDNNNITPVVEFGRNTSNRKKNVTLASRSGLVFPTGRIKRYLKNSKIANRVSVGSAVYCSAILEYLVAEILELASNAARENNRTRITPRHLNLAIRNDEELSRLVGNQTVIAGGGVMPHIHEVLLPKNSSQNRASKHNK